MFVVIPVHTRSARRSRGKLEDIVAMRIFGVIAGKRV